MAARGQRRRKELSPAPVKGRRRRLKPIKLWREVPLLLAIALVLALGIKTFVVQAFYIPSQSMENTIMVGDRVLVNKFSPWFGAQPQRGQIVVFEDPGGWLPDTPTPDTSNVAVRFFHKNGSLVWMEVSARMVEDLETGQPKEMILVARDLTERKKLEDQLLAMAMTDGLTGLSNRRAFDAELERQWIQVLENSSQVSLVLLDIDHFKQLNDEYGHLAGDDCLRVIGAAVRSAVRGADVVARYGGEEIAIILPSTDPAEALKIAEAVRTAIEDLNIEHAGNPEGGNKVTASLGVATALARAGGAIRMPESLVLSADKALYMAKSEGRNCVRKVMMMAAPNNKTAEAGR